MITLDSEKVVDCSPEGIPSNKIFLRGFLYSFNSLKIILQLSFLLNSARIASVAETNCEQVVAKARPATSKLRYLTKITVKTSFTTPEISK